MCRRTVRTFGLHDCDSVFKILMYPSPHIYICICLRVCLLFFVSWISYISRTHLVLAVHVKLNIAACLKRLSLFQPCIKLAMRTSSAAGLIQAWRASIRHFPTHAAVI